jgi:hypothetical protein
MENSTLQLTELKDEMPRSKRLPEAWTTGLFSRLGMMYGQRFRSAFLSPAAVDEWVQTWGRGLAGLSSEELKHGLARCIQECPDFAPTLGRFREMCVGKPPAVDPSHRPWIPLDEPRASLEVEEKHMAHIREILSRPSNRPRVPGEDDE